MNTALVPEFLGKIVHFAAHRYTISVPIGIAPRFSGAGGAE
jgi:hypothetical protein